MHLPDYNFLPGPLWLITLLQLVTLTLHFVAMNFLFGGLVVILWGKFTDRWQHPVVQQQVKLLPTLMAATITLGVAPLLFLQVVFPKQVYAASIISGWFWLAVVPVIIVTYYLLYAAAFAGPENKRRGTYLFLAFLGMLYVAFMFSSVMSLAEQPELMMRTYAAHQSGCVVNPNIGSYIIRWLHMLFGAVTVGGFFIGLIGRDNEQAFSVGKGFYLWGMAAAAIMGMVYLFTLGDILLPLMRTPAIWALTIGIVLSAASLHFYFKKRFCVAGTMLGISMLAMVFTRHTVRLLHLTGQFNPAEVTVKAQWGPFVMFLICFVIMLGVMVYMIRVFFRERQNATA
ncbi:MAG: hypothetical protein D6800_12125 [Candidatus Zixiibacteriota bacterium]|nr:MAG: hypothetical protein D6800_12125 [candidate division Zixibacteria bacterium]